MDHMKIQATQRPREKAPYREKTVQEALSRSMLGAHGRNGGGLLAGVYSKD